MQVMILSLVVILFYTNNAKAFGFWNLNPDISSVSFDIDSNHPFIGMNCGTISEYARRVTTTYVIFGRRFMDAEIQTGGGQFQGVFTHVLNRYEEFVRDNYEAVSASLNDERLYLEINYYFVQLTSAECAAANQANLGNDTLNTPDEFRYTEADELSASEVDTSHPYFGINCELLRDFSYYVATQYLRDDSVTLFVSDRAAVYTLSVFWTFIEEHESYYSFVTASTSEQIITASGEFFGYVYDICTRTNSGE